MLSGGYMVQILEREREREISNLCWFVQVIDLEVSGLVKDQGVVFVNQIYSSLRMLVEDLNLIED